MPDEFDIIYAFKFTLSNNGHEKNSVINSCVFVNNHYLFTDSRKNEFSSAAKTGCRDRS
jgi:hypothetical protein